LTFGHGFEGILQKQSELDLMDRSLHIVHTFYLAFVIAVSALRGGSDIRNLEINCEYEDRYTIRITVVRHLSSKSV